MCRLFGMHAGTTPIDATFWLAEAPDSLESQSHANSDGFGIGTFDADGAAVVDKSPLPAWQDAEFARAAHRLHGTTFVAHVRKASTGALTLPNTHPFLQDGRLFAHNGALQQLEALDSRLADLGATDLVHGDTDSERYFALITAETRRAGGDVGAGIEAAVTWISANVPLISLNFVLATPTDLWALRYPSIDTLFVLERGAGGLPANAALDARGSHMTARSAPLAERASVIAASERLDDDPGWREIPSGELLHVSADLATASTRLFA